ncbi:MAG: Mg-protoporphyrin IX monomethyl ester oxidative cyclase [Bacteroidia bacterium]|nr:MAG: Mg-protoporphyrin IX monomethyl ester oxidative cyclase [Bacteroidia bacterium]
MASVSGTVRMIDVLFTHSYFARFDPKEWKARMPYPPLGTITAAGFLRTKGWSVALHDVMFSENESDILPALRQFDPRMVVLYDDGFNYLTKMCLTRMREAAFRLIEHAKRHGSIVAVFSSDAADRFEEYLSRGADYILCGEAEETLEELCRAVLGSGDTLARRSSSSESDFGGRSGTSDTGAGGSAEVLAAIPGLAFTAPDGKVRKTGRRIPLKDLDILPIPAWDLVDMEKYRSVWHRHHGYFSLNISTTRGCPFHCNWCAKPLYGQVYHSRSPRHVIEEMKHLKANFSPDHLWITDDIFGLKPGWIREFAELIRSENAMIPYKCLSRVDLLLNDETAKHLKDSGCKTVWVGAESGSQRILDAMDKGTSVEEIRSATRLLREHGIQVGFFLQFGYPGETREDIDKTLEMVRVCQPDEIGVSVSYPLPGTLFYERVRAEMERKQNWETSDDFDPMFRATYSREYYRRLHTVIHKRFRIWRGLRTLKRVTADPKSLDHSSIRALASMVVQSMTLPHHLRGLRRLERSKSHG